MRDVVRELSAFAAAVVIVSALMVFTVGAVCALGIFGYALYCVLTGAA